MRSGVLTQQGASGVGRPGSRPDDGYIIIYVYSRKLIIPLEKHGRFNYPGFRHQQMECPDFKETFIPLKLPVLYHSRRGGTFYGHLLLVSHLIAVRFRERVCLE